MKALICEMCGSTNLIKEGGVFVCQSCGTKYSVEEAKKMMVEGTVDVKGTVKVDTSDELKNLYEIARRAKETDNNDKAEKYYDMILIKDPNSWEANFYTTYYNAMSCKIGEISLAADKVSNSFKSTIDLAKSNLNDQDYLNAINEIAEKSQSIAFMLGNAAINQYRGIDSQVKDQFTTEYMNHVLSSAGILLKLGSELAESNKDLHKELIQTLWTSGISILTAGVDACPMIDPTSSKSQLKNIANIYEQRIAELNPEYVAKTHSSSGCIVTLMVMLTGLSSLAACCCFLIDLI